MFIFRGRLPALTIVAVLLLPWAAAAQDAHPLALGEAEDLALGRDPGRAALLERADGLAERATAAGQLPDPELRVGLANFPISSGGFSTEGMTQAQLGYRQDFPSGRSREFGTQRFESLAAGMTANADARDRDVLMFVRDTWLEAHYWQRAREIVTESRPFFSDLVTVTRSLYSVGRKTQHDVLRAELELGRLDDRLLEIERHHSEAKAALSEWLGSEASRPIAAALPEWQQVPPLAALQNNLASHPAVIAAAARVAAGDAGVAVAEERKKPGWALDVGYGYREGYLPSGEPRSDFISVSVTMDLPFFQENRQDRALAAALNERSALRYEKDELLQRLSSRLEVEYTRWQDQTRRLVLFESLILDLSEDQAQAALLAYQSDAGDFADVMRGYIDDLDTRLDHVRLQVERGQTYAVLANLGGLSR